MSLILAIIAGIIPFQFTLSPLFGVDISILRIIIILATLITITTIIINKPFYAPRSTLPTLIALFLITAFLSITVTYDITWFTRKFIFLLNFFALFFIITLNIGIYTIVLRMIRIATLSGICAAITALLLWTMQFLTGADTVTNFWQHIIAPFFLGNTITDSIATYSSAYVNIAGTNYLRAVGFFPDPHIAAFFFELTLPFTIAFATIAPTTQQRLLWYSGTAIVLFALLATFTRGAYVALFFSVIILLLGTLPLLTARAVRRSIIALCASVLCISILAITTPLGGRITSIISNHDRSVSARLIIWHDAIDTITLHPFLGVGLGNYPFTQNIHADYRDPYYAHNLYLDIAVEMGIGALIIWISIITTAIWRFLRYHQRPIGIAGAMSLMLYSIHSLFDTALFSVHTLPLLLIIITMATYENHTRHHITAHSITQPSYPQP